jgi:dUTP pyrophosphatase
MSAMMIPTTLKCTTVTSFEYTAVTPTRGSAVAAGYDLCAFLPQGTFETRVASYGMMTDSDGVMHKVPCEHIKTATTIPVGGRALIPTGLSMAIPAGWYGRIAPRSGLAWKNGIDVLAGVIDADYLGDIGVVLSNGGSTDFQIQHGDRIAQIIIERCGDAEFVRTLDALPPTVRGECGYGSTGIAATLTPRGGLPKGGFRLSISDDGMAQISPSHRRTASVSPDDADVMHRVRARERSRTPSITAIPEHDVALETHRANMAALMSASETTSTSVSIANYLSLGTTYSPPTRVFPGSAEIGAAH